MSGLGVIKKPHSQVIFYGYNKQVTLQDQNKNISIRANNTPKNRGWPWLLGAALLLPISAVTGFELIHANHVFPGVRAAGQDVGGLTLAEAQAKLAAAPAQAPNLTVHAGNRELRLQANDLGWQRDVAATIKNAFEVGRTGSLAEKISAQWNAVTARNDVAGRAVVNQSQLREELGKLAGSLYKPAINAKIVLNQKTAEFVLKSDANGLRFDVDAAVQEYVANPNQTDLTLQPQTVLATVRAENLKQSVNTANSFVRAVGLRYPKPAEVTEPASATTVGATTDGIAVDALLKPTDNKPVAELSLNKFEVAAMLQLSAQGVGIEPKSLTALLNRLQYFNLAARGARYVRVGGVSGTSLKVRPNQTGWKLDRANAALLIKQKILSNEANPHIELPVVAAPPELTLAELPKQEELKLLSEVTTYYTGSPNERTYNVSVAASKIDGYVVGAGEEFNFNNALGDIGTETGFAEALVISNGRTIKGVGGGVCQSSTTTFRALYKLGLPVVERNQHAYKVHWYEPHVGFDAAVYQPSVNMRMTNDTAGPLLVRASTLGQSLTVQIYGVPDGRKVFVSDPTILWRLPYGPPIYEFDRFKRYGAIEQVDWAVEGMGVRRYRTVTMANGEKKTDTLFSNYKPWRAVYKVGPGVRGFGVARTSVARRATKR